MVRPAVWAVVRVGMSLYTGSYNLSPSHQPDARAPKCAHRTHEAKDLGDKAAGKLRSEHTTWTIRNPPQSRPLQAKKHPPRPPRTVRPPMAPRPTAAPPPRQSLDAKSRPAHRPGSFTRSASSTRESRKSSLTSQRN